MMKKMIGARGAKILHDAICNGDISVEAEETIGVEHFNEISDRIGFPAFFYAVGEERYNPDEINFDTNDVLSDCSDEPFEPFDPENSCEFFEWVQNHCYDPEYCRDWQDEILIDNIDEFSSPEDANECLLKIGESVWLFRSEIQRLAVLFRLRQCFEKIPKTPIKEKSSSSKWVVDRFSEEGIRLAAIQKGKELDLVMPQIAVKRLIAKMEADANTPEQMEAAREMWNQYYITLAVGDGPKENDY